MNLCPVGHNAISLIPQPYLRMRQVKPLPPGGASSSKPDPGAPPRSAGAVRGPGAHLGELCLQPQSTGTGA